MMRTLIDNFTVVLGPDASADLIRRTAEEALRHAARTYYDLYHSLSLGPEALAAGADFSPQAAYYLDEVMSWGRGVIVAGCHMSNFDQAALAFAVRGGSAHLLSWANPPRGYDIQNEVRRSLGLELTPISPAALRLALRNLRNGGLVVTGVDRPDPSGLGEKIPFFGQPARMPMGHVRLALQTHSPIIVATCEFRPNEGTYLVHSTPPLEIERVGSRQETILYNTRRVLDAVEGFVRAHPEQWLMFYPVWHEDLNKPAP